MSKCARCNRGLTDPISIKRGYGPVCWAKAQADKSKEEQRESGGFYDGGDIVLHREKGNATTNVPHAIVLHQTLMGAELKPAGDTEVD